MEIDMRSVSPQRLLNMESILNEQMQRALEDYNKTVNKGDLLTVNVEKIGDRPSGELGENLPLILKAIAATNYSDAKPTLTRGSTDSNIPIALGIPAITIGRGSQSANAHSLDEWYLNDESGALAIKLSMLILVAEAGLAK
jgi:di/tripeptidase